MCAHVLAGVVAVAVMTLWLYLRGSMAKVGRGKSLRVAFVHPDLGIGGAERLVVDAAVGLQSLGHTVIMYTSHHDPAHAFDETKDGTLKVKVGAVWLLPPLAFVGTAPDFTEGGTRVSLYDADHKMTALCTGVWGFLPTVDFRAAPHHVCFGGFPHFNSPLVSTWSQFSTRMADFPLTAAGGLPFHRDATLRAAIRYPHRRPGTLFWPMNSLFCSEVVAM